MGTATADEVTSNPDGSYTISGGTFRFTASSDGTLTVKDLTVRNALGEDVPLFSTFRAFALDPSAPPSFIDGTARVPGNNGTFEAHATPRGHVIVRAAADMQVTMEPAAGLGAFATGTYGWVGGESLRAEVVPVGGGQVEWTGFELDARVAAGNAVLVRLVGPEGFVAPAILAGDYLADLYLMKRGGSLVQDVVAFRTMTGTTTFVSESRLEMTVNGPSDGGALTISLAKDLLAVPADDLAVTLNGVVITPLDRPDQVMAADHTSVAVVDGPSTIDVVLRASSLAGATIVFAPSQAVATTWPLALIGTAVGVTAAAAFVMFRRRET